MGNLKHLKILENEYYIQREKQYESSIDKNKEEYDRLWQLESDRVSENIKKRKILENKRISYEKIKKSLVMSGIDKIVSESLKINNISDDNSKRLLYLESIIEEDFDGINDFNMKMCNKNYILSNIINEATLHFKSILEEKDSENDDEIIIKIDNKDVDEYIEKIDSVECDRLANIIADKVSRTIADFIICNQREKSEIKNIVDKYQKKIDSEKDEEISESYVSKCNAEINKLGRNRYKTLYEIMVNKLAENVITNKDYMMIENKVDMDSIINAVNVMYTVLETANTLNILHIDSDKIKNILETF